MRAPRHAPIAALACAAMLVGPQAAEAKTHKLPLPGGAGHAVLKIDQIGGVSDLRTTARLQACDDDDDGAGVVARVSTQAGPQGPSATSRGGEGTCGKAVSIGSGEYYFVTVCVHDQSKYGKLKKNWNWGDRGISVCKTKLF